jgi:hypothetical protein
VQVAAFTVGAHHNQQLRIVSDCDLIQELLQDIAGDHDARLQPTRVIVAGHLDLRHIEAPIVIGKPDRDHRVVVRADALEAERGRSLWNILVPHCAVKLPVAALGKSGSVIVPELPVLKRLPRVQIVRKRQAARQDTRGDVEVVIGNAFHHLESQRAPVS